MDMNAETLCVHKANKNTDKNDSCTWRAMCGWNFGLHPFKKITQLPEKPYICNRCFNIRETGLCRDKRDKTPAEETTREDTGSSSDSSSSSS